MLVFTRKNYQQLNRLLGMSLVVLLMALFMAPDAFAGKPACNLKKNPDGCPGTDPGDVPGWVLTPVTDTGIAFDGQQVSSGDGDDWPCNQITLEYTNGLYTCIPNDGQIMLRTGGGNTTREFASKHRAICEGLIGEELGPNLGLTPDTLSYGWTDRCSGPSDNTCAIKVNMHFSDDATNGTKIADATGGKANTLSVVLHGTADTSDDDPYNDDNRESNPFYISRNVAIDSFDMDFRMAGSSRTAALCTVHTPGGGNSLISVP